MALILEWWQPQKSEQDKNKDSCEYQVTWLGA